MGWVWCNVFYPCSEMGWVCCGTSYLCSELGWVYCNVCYLCSDVSYPCSDVGWLTCYVLSYLSFASVQARVRVTPIGSPLMNRILWVWPTENLSSVGVVRLDQANQPIRGTGESMTSASSLAPVSLSSRVFYPKKGWY